MKTTLRRTFIAALLAIAAASLASANSIGFTTTFPVEGSDPNTDFNFSLSLPEFNVANATLTNVVLILYAQENASSVTLTNGGSSTESDFNATASSNIYSNISAVGNPLFNSATGANVSGGLTLNVFGVSGITLGPNTTGACPAGTPSSSCSSVTYGPFEDDVTNDPTGYTTVTGIAASPVTGIQLNAGNINDYYGSGQFTLSGGTKGAVTILGGGSVGGDVISTGTLDAEVDYTYTLNTGTPEPASMLLMGGALVGLGMLGKKRFGKS